MPILEDAFKKSKKCFVPRFESKNNVMRMLNLKDMDDYNNLPIIMWNIKQPKATEGREDAMETRKLQVSNEIFFYKTVISDF